MLVAEGVPSSTIRQIFSPATPVMLPAILPNPLLAREPEEGTAHIDVEFELGKYGTSRRIDVVGASRDAQAASEKTLVRLIASNRFRPKLTANPADPAASYRVRYYVGE